MTTPLPNPPPAAHPSTDDTPGVVAPPPLLYAGTLLLGLLLHRFFPAPLLLLPRLPARAAGAVLLVAAGGLAVGAFRTMARARTDVNPYRPTTAIVITGPFRFSRNPIYLSLTLLYLGVTLLLVGAALWPLLLLAPLLAVMRWGVIAREERYLEGKFGDEYRRFRGRVRRWL